MEELDHLDFTEFMEEQELKLTTLESNKELDEDVTPTTGE